MNEPDFTIITPSYNYGHYIGECLQSVANQKGASFEHLVMDAGSSDDTIAVVSEHPHATWYQEPDKGMSDGINKGFKIAKGDWVMWLNADDRLKPGALLKVKEHIAEMSNVDVVFGGWDFINAKGDHTRTMTPTPFDFRTLIQHGCYIGSTACFFRRSSIIDEGHLLNIDFGFCMDGEYYARLASLGKKFKHIPYIIADFRLHDQSISQGHLGKSDLKGVLTYQRQAAEPRALRRLYGFKPFRDENLSMIVDGILFHVYRFKKWLMRIWERRKCQYPPYE